MSKSITDQERWKQEDDETWRALEDSDITVCCNEEYDEDNDETIYLVFPAYKNRGIPNSPSTFSVSGWGSEEQAHEYALKEAAKIRELTTDQIRKFKWSMIK